MPTTLTDEEEIGFQNWYKAIAQQNNLPKDPDEPVEDKGELVVPEHRRFFKRLINDDDFATGVDNLIKHSQYNLDTGKAKYFTNDDGSVAGVSSIHSTSRSEEAGGPETLLPSTWEGKNREGDDLTSYARQSLAEGHWPTVSATADRTAVQEADDASNWIHHLVMKQTPKTEVGQRALSIGY